MPGSRRVLLTEGEHGPAAPPAQVAMLRRDLIAWYDACRRDLPWRRTRDPWAVWVSEIMLQQTRVETVIPYFERFLARFPTPLALAEAPEDQVLAAWSGLGYYRRARLLHAGARAVAAAPIPDQRDGLLALPGIGRYTAGAIASIAFGRAVGLVDGNVARVLARLFAIEDDMKRGGMKKAEALADELVPRDRPGDWNQALMELGATVCTPRSPACDRCPVARDCRARAEGKVDRLPVLGEKTKPKPQKLAALVARSGGKVLLARRRSDGLFGGLWEPPMVATAAALKAAFAVRDAKKVGTVVHVLSHRRLTIDVLTASAHEAPAALPDPYEAAGFFDELSLGELGISTLARKVLAAGTC
ncbi:MAG: A/G-specific adenine glycosylase [Labilithrix sp.]|nr:A/G-specific adenine glycosylase [Labilithrix sp.]MCW5816894.1 A/G-specific adenine glycosylase [Labilithrix sp.]